MNGCIKTLQEVSVPLKLLFRLVLFFLLLSINALRFTFSARFNNKSQSVNITGIMSSLPKTSLGIISFDVKTSFLSKSYSRPNKMRTHFVYAWLLPSLSSFFCFKSIFCLALHTIMTWFFFTRVPSFVLDILTGTNLNKKMKLVLSWLLKLHEGSLYRAYSFIYYYYLISWYKIRSSSLLLTFWCCYVLLLRPLLTTPQATPLIM